jgi:hypothetical protein
MKTTLQLAKLLREDLHRRGLIRDIVAATELDRHTVSAWLRSDAKYVSLHSISKLCEYLIDRGVNPDILPGALFGKEPEKFMDMLAERRNVSFALAFRRHPQWRDNEYVMASDMQLHGALIAATSALDKLDKPNVAADLSADDGEDTGGARQTAPTLLASIGNEVVAARDDSARTFNLPHLIPAPRMRRGKNSSRRPGDNEWRERARAVYDAFLADPEADILFTLGSVRVNGILEILAAELFNATPFCSQDEVAVPADRACPFYFRYRNEGPTPESACGGLQLACNYETDEPGIYYETKDGTWNHCPFEAGKSDVAFVLFARYSNVDKLHVACGGFSGTATRMLAKCFNEVATSLWPPQFTEDELNIGLYLIPFASSKTDGTISDGSPHVIRIDDEVIRRRLVRATPADAHSVRPASSSAGGGTSTQNQPRSASGSKPVA